MTTDIEHRLAELAEWLRAKTGDGRLLVLGCRRLNGGLSNLTYRLDVGHHDGSGRRSFLLRADPLDGIAPSYDISAQFHIQRALAGSSVPVPVVHWLESDPAVLGRTCWVGDFVEHELTPRLLPTDHPRTTNRLRSFTATLAGIHDVDWSAVGLDSWCPTLTPSQVPKVLDDYWRRGRAHLDHDDPVFRAAMKWLERDPPRGPVALVHGDCSLSNYLFHGDEVAAVIDWELAVLGDPLIDIAFYCSILWRHRHASDSERSAERRQFLDLYREHAAIDDDRLHYWEVFSHCRNGLSWLRPPSDVGARDAVHAYRSRLRLGSLLSIPHG